MNISKFNLICNIHIQILKMHDALQVFLILPSSGQGHLQVNPKSLKSKGLSQISQRPGRVGGGEKEVGRVVGGVRREGIGGEVGGG